MKTEQKIKHINDLLKLFKSNKSKVRVEYEALIDRVKMTIKKLCTSESDYVKALNTKNVFGLISLHDELKYYEELLKRLKAELELDHSNEENNTNVTKKKFLNLPATISEIYHETIFAHEYGLNYLCACGLRAIIEGICKDKNIKSGIIPNTSKRNESLKGRIYGLAELNLISITNATILTTNHQYLGDKAIHELKKPSKEELEIAIEIIDLTLDTIYELEHKGNQLQIKTQNRVDQL